MRSRVTARDNPLAVQQFHPDGVAQAYSSAVKSTGGIQPSFGGGASWIPAPVRGQSEEDDRKPI